MTPSQVNDSNGFTIQACGGMQRKGGEGERTHRDWCCEEGKEVGNGRETLRCSEYKIDPVLRRLRSATRHKGHAHRGVKESSARCGGARVHSAGCWFCVRHADASAAASSGSFPGVPHWCAERSAGPGEHRGARRAFNAEHPASRPRVTLARDRWERAVLCALPPSSGCPWLPPSVARPVTSGGEPRQVFLLVSLVRTLS